MIDIIMNRSEKLPGRAYISIEKANLDKAKIDVKVTFAPDKGHDFTQGMVSNKLSSTFLAQIILRTIRFLAIPFYLCALAIGAMEGDFYLHFFGVLKKINLDTEMVYFDYFCVEY
jgi:hypothetical protein